MTGQMRLPIESGNSEQLARFDTIFAIPADARRRTEVDRLKDELASLQGKQHADDARKARLSRRMRKRTERSLSLAAQIESIERNPYAILRYRSLVPDIDQSRAWYNQPIDAIRPETIGHIGGARLRLLVSLCPTIGDLEALRIYEGISSIRGIGQLLAKRIERRLLRWLQANAFGYDPAPSYEDYRQPVERGCPSHVEIEIQADEDA